MVRSLRILLFLVALAALAAGAYHARSGVAALADARQATATAQRQLPVLKERLATLQARQAYDREVERILERAERLELERERWSERRLRQARGRVSREQALSLLGATRSGRRSIFIPSTFELSVPEPGLGLFEKPAFADREVNLELAGTLHLLVGGRRP